MHILTKNTINYYYFFLFLLGYGYDQSTESDILLLDISNNDEYVWTEDFVPPTSPTNNNTDNEDHGSGRSRWNNKLFVIVSIAESVVGVVILIVGGLLLRIYKNKRGQKTGSGDEDDYKQEDSEKGIPPTDDKKMLEAPKSVITKV